jgi:hypothetical protein
MHCLVYTLAPGTGDGRVRVRAKGEWQQYLRGMGGRRRGSPHVAPHGVHKVHGVWEGLPPREANGGHGHQGRWRGRLYTGL